jgi:hypothetical protein
LHLRFSAKHEDFGFVIIHFKFIAFHPGGYVFNAVANVRDEVRNAGGMCGVVQLGIVGKEMIQVARAFEHVTKRFHIHGKKHRPKYRALGDPVLEDGRG